MEIVVHQDDGVGLRGQILVVIAPIGGRKGDHQFQVPPVQGYRQIVYKAREVLLARFRD